MKNYFEKFLAILLYVIPVVFFTACYFLITTSAEDINQGAGSPVNILHELKEAFLYNPRLGELYTWPMINVFDYQFVFGPDAILRMFDVVLAVAMLLALFTVSTARLPKLKLKDALVFATGFLLLVLATTQYSEVFYARFSFIHNYLIASLFFLLFILPYSLEVHGKSLPKTKKFFVASALLGFLFGMSSQVTPIVILMTLMVVFLLNCLSKRPTFGIRKILMNWKFYSIIGILGAIFVMYGLGPGIASHYANDQLLNYVAFSDLLTQPVHSIRAVLSNLLKNIATLLPYIMLFGISAIWCIKLTGKITTKTTSRYLLYTGVFCTIYILILSQISFQTLLRVTLPIYITTILVILFTLEHWLHKISTTTVHIVSALLCSLCLFATIDMTKNQITYREQVKPTLTSINKGSLSDVCVPKSSIKTPVSIFGFHQSPLLEEWAMPMKIYDKNVTFCE